MLEIIQPILAPAVMFSAGGLLCLAQFARLNAIVGQIRAFDRERLTTLREMTKAEPEQRDLLEQRAAGLELQSDGVLAHAVVVKNALRFLVGGILLMVLCSLLVGASFVFEPLSIVAIVLFVLGLISTFVGLCLVLTELGVSLDPLKTEHENLKRLRRSEGLLPPEVRATQGEEFG
jgi:hypothetical protein